MIVPPSSSAKPGGAAPAGGAAPLAAASKPAAPEKLAQPFPADQQSPALFGGHRGGGKKRLDGLPAGSEAAKAADRERDRLRKAVARDAKKLAALPPALPGAPAPAPGAAAAVPAGGPAVPGVAPGVVAPASVAPGLAPMFVAWSEKVLSRPVRLATRIMDRLRVSALMQRIRRLNLNPEQEKELEKSVEYKAEAVADFNTSLTNCLAVEFNKRAVPGAQHSHWIDVLMTGGELVHCHMDTIDKLEKMIAENDLKKKQAQVQAAAKPDASALMKN